MSELNTKMTAIADEIRELSNTSNKMNLDTMTNNLSEANSEINTQTDLIEQIVTALNGKAAGGDITLPTLNNPGTASDLLEGKELIDGNGNVVTGTIPTQTAQTITPGTTDKTIASGKYLTGTQTIKGDANLVAENIVKGKSIFGVEGSAESGGGGAIPTYSGTIITPMLLGSGEYAFLYIDNNLTVKIIKCPVGYQEIPITIAAGTLIVQVVGRNGLEIPYNEEEILNGEIYLDQHIEISHIYRPTSDNFIWALL